MSAKIDIAKVHANGTPTPCSIALADLIQTQERLHGKGGLYDQHRAKGYDDDRIDKMISTMEGRVSGLEEQIRRIVREQLGVDYSILWQAFTG